MWGKKTGLWSLMEHNAREGWGGEIVKSCKFTVCTHATNLNSVMWDDSTRFWNYFQHKYWSLNRTHPLRVLANVPMFLCKYS